METETNIVIEKDGDVYCSDSNAKLTFVKAGEIKECKCCGGNHRINYLGDCRNDSERIYPLN